MINVRIFFKKIGRARYISHLDLNRCFQRALKRAQLPVWYTMGFNPHMYITFPLPISLGFESEWECVDLRLNEPLPMEEVAARLSAQMPEGIEILMAAPPKMDQKEIAFADYEVGLTFQEDGEAALSALEGYFAQKEIWAEKKSKKGMLLVDIRPLFEVLSIVQQEDKIQLNLRVVTGITQNLNPNLIFSNFTEIPILHTHICRKMVYNAELEKFQ